MGFTDSRWLIAVVAAVVALVVAAYVMGGVSLGGVQGLLPVIVDARGEQEREKARSAKLENDKTEETIRHQKTENLQSEKKTEKAIATQSAWDEMVMGLVRDAGATVLSVSREWGLQLGSALSSVVVIAALAIAIRTVLAPLLDRHPRAGALPIASRDLIAASPNGNTEAVLAYKQTRTEKNVHRAARELARQRERRDRAQALRNATPHRFNGNQRAA